LEGRWLPTGGIPALHSLPGAPAAVYLDFGGETLPNGTRLRAYDEDGDPNTFTAAEQASIREAWRQTAAYFAVFKVDVTTVRPTGPFAWAVISPDIGGGYSSVGTFPATSPQSFLSADDARWRQSAIAHEVGHQFGLSHQSDYDLRGKKTNEYSSGYDPLHGPIMGVDYAGVVHKWFLGHPSYSPSELQDDIARIASALRPYTGGDGFRADDFGGTIATATPMSWASSDPPRMSISGVLERLDDVDAFSFTTSVMGRYQIEVNRDTPSGVHAKFAIYTGNGTLIAAKDGPTNDQQLTLDLSPFTTYYLLVSSHGDYGDVGAYNVEVRWMQSGWSAQDIGYVGYPGYAGNTVLLLGGQFAVGGSGADIGGTADAFRYAYTPLTGDGSIVALVSAQTDTDPSAKAGVMLRESLAAGSRYAMMGVMPGNNGLLDSVGFWDRPTTDGGSTGGTPANALGPYWVRLVRSGNTFTGFRSADGVHWTPGGSATIAMGPTIYIGLAVTSHNNNAVSAVTFSNVALTGRTGPAVPRLNSLPAPAGLALSLGSGTGIRLSWNGVGGATGYAVDRSDDGVNWTEVTRTSADARTFDDVGLFGSMNYFYRVSALDAVGRSTPSATATIVNRPNAPFNLTATPLATNSLVLNWRDVSGETGYRVVRPLDGIGWQVITLPRNVTSYYEETLSPGRTYDYRVYAVMGPTESTAAEVVGTTPRSDALPPPWRDADIGSTKFGGWATWNAGSGTFGVNASGSDIFGTADALHYVYQPITGDSEIIARVTAVQDTDGWAKAGVMFRESLAANARHAFMLVTAGNGTGFQDRPTAGGLTTSSNFTAAATAPYWVRLVRAGNTFTGFRSADGVTWTQVDSQTVAMNATVFVGLAVTAHNNVNVNTSTFTHVTVQAARPAPPPSGPGLGAAQAQGPRAPELHQEPQAPDDGDGDGGRRGYVLQRRARPGGPDDTSGLLMSLADQAPGRRLGGSGEGTVPSGFLARSASGLRPAAGLGESIAPDGLESSLDVVDRFFATCQ
jgi:hypothetical protein